MLRIAVTDDEQSCREQLAGYIRQYGQEIGAGFEVHTFPSGEALLAADPASFAIILLDIQMQGTDGMSTARAIRAVNDKVVLMFITNMAQYALQGYEVDALDFVLKPINYYTFSLRFKRAIERATSRKTKQVLLHTRDKVLRLDTEEIFYIESQNRMLLYHTAQGVFEVRATMQAAEEELAPFHFVKCNHWYLVNLAHVRELHKDTVLVAGAELEISRRGRTAFLAAVTDYVGGNT